MIDHKVILDATGISANETLASGIASTLTSEAHPFFRIGLQDRELAEFRTVRPYLSAVQDIIYSILSRSNFYGAGHSMYEELGGFATGAVGQFEDYYTVTRFQNFTVGEFYLGVDIRGKVDKFAREYQQTVEQVVKDFGIDNVSIETQNKYNNKNLDQYITIRHLIIPNTERISGKIDNRNMGWRSYKWEVSNQDEKYLSVSGFEEFPIHAPRWGVVGTSSVYGTGPGWKALGDVKMLQVLQKDKLLALAKLNDPPVRTNGRDRPNTLPGGINFNIQDGSLAPLYQINPDIQAIENTIFKTQQKIDSHFYKDLFLMMVNDDRSGVTAREVAERHEEKLIQCGPFIHKIKDEFLDPSINRTYNIALRAGKLPPPPEEIQGMELKIEYISVLAQAQKMVGTTAIEQHTRFVGTIAAIKPEVLDIINWDKAAVRYGEMVGSDDIIRSKEEIAEIRQAAQKAAEQAQMQQAVGNAVQGAKVLSDTPVGQNSALDALMGTGGQS